MIMVLSLSVMYQFAAAQCSGNKIRIVKGSYHCGCHCQKKCVSPAALQTYLADGWYQGDVCFGSCCWIRSGEDVSIETSLEEIYPNPASGVVFIAMKKAGTFEMEVLNSIGQQLYPAAFNSSPDEKKVDFSPLPNGIYFIQIKTPDNLFRKKVVIMR